MQERARPATSADLGVLTDLAMEAIQEQVEARGGWIWSRREARSSPFNKGLAEAINDSAQGVWVGEIDDAPVGYCVTSLSTLSTGETLGTVEDLYVTPQAREVAVGERLIEVVLDWCKERNCVGIDALALPGNRSTKNFFESFGFKARLLTVHRPLT